MFVLVLEGVIYEVIGKLIDDNWFLRVLGIFWFFVVFLIEVINKFFEIIVFEGVIWNKGIFLDVVFVRYWE